MRECLTRVAVAFYPEYLNFWLRFGAPETRHDLDRRRSLALFGPGQIFGYIRWIANAYGTQAWRIVIVQTGAPRTLISRIEGIWPGGDILLSASGTSKIKQVLTQIDHLEESGFLPERVSPAYYRHLHNRIAARCPIHPYTDAQQEAFEAACRVLP